MESKSKQNESDSNETSVKNAGKIFPALCHLYLIYLSIVFSIALSSFSFINLRKLQNELQANNDWVSILMGQLAEVRSQVDTSGVYDYNMEWHRQQRDGSDEGHRFKRQISSLLDNCVCPQGPPGPPGPRGKRGKKAKRGIPGRPGPPGIPGPPGKNGFPGPIGLDGPKGEQGFKGDKGDKGDIGSPGYDIIDKIQANALGYTVTWDEVLMLKGEPGSAGPVGPPGLQGEPGLPGYDGIQGRPGEPGMKGDPGTKGDPGVPGSPGSPGEKGAKGDRGVMSSAGIGTGDFPTAIIEGPPGPPGEKGERGDPGIDGNPGARGRNGKRGRPGPPGIDGPKGEPGSSGIPGGKGEPGTPGIDGIPGGKGDKGDQGEPGIPGKRGKRGPKGDIGPPGPPGLDAPCPIGPDGLPLAGCGWRKSKPDPLPEVGTSFAGTTSLEPSSGYPGFSPPKPPEDPKTYFGTVTSNSRFGSLDSGSLDPPSSQYGTPSYYSPPASPPGSGATVHYGEWDGDYDDDYDDEDPPKANNKRNEEPTYGVHSWWETPSTNYQPPSTYNWEGIPKPSNSNPGQVYSKRSTRHGQHSNKGDKMRLDAKNHN